MNIKFLLNHPAEEQVSYVPTEEEILARIANPVPLAEDDDDDDSFEIQPVSVDDAAAICTISGFNSRTPATTSLKSFKK